VAADVAALLRRLGALKSKRTVVEQEWRNCFDYSMPMRGAQLATMGAGSADGNLSYGANKKAELLDSTATDAVRIHSSALMSGLTPANSRWFGLDAGATSEDEGDESAKWLDNVAEFMWESIHASNFDAVGFDCCMDMTIAGMFALYITENDEGLQFEQWPLASCYFGASRRGGGIDTVFREVQLSAEQCVAEYGANMVSEKTRDLASTKPDEAVSIVWAIYPRKDARGNQAQNMPVASCHFEKDSKAILRESGFHEMPVIVPRWGVLPDSVYALGPMHDALPDAKTLNEVVRYVLANADMAIAGMWIAEDDGVLNPKTIRIGPRKVIVANSVDSMKALQPASKFDIAVLEIDRLQRSIRKVLMADQLTPKDGPAITATEATINVELIRQQLGPMYGRMQSEYMQPMIDRVFGLMFRDGAFGNPPQELVNKSFRVQYRSPIARSQKAVDVAAMDRYEASLVQEAAGTGKMDLLDNYAWDKATRKRAALLGVPADLMVDSDLVEETRAQRAEQQEEQQATEMLASVVRDQKGNISGLARPA
jgi:hypothetical protein